MQKSKVGQTDRQTNRQTDIVTYRVACTRLKIDQKAPRDRQQVVNAAMTKEEQWWWSKTMAIAIRAFLNDLNDPLLPSANQKCQWNKKRAQKLEIIEDHGRFFWSMRREHHSPVLNAYFASIRSVSLSNHSNNSTACSLNDKNRPHKKTKYFVKTSTITIHTSD